MRRAIEIRLIWWSEIRNLTISCKVRAFWRTKRISQPTSNLAWRSATCLKSCRSLGLSQASIFTSSNRSSRMRRKLWSRRTERVSLASEPSIDSRLIRNLIVYRRTVCRWLNRFRRLNCRCHRKSTRRAKSIGTRRPWPPAKATCSTITWPRQRTIERHGSCRCYPVPRIVMRSSRRHVSRQDCWGHQIERIRLSTLRMLTTES